MRRYFMLHFYLVCYPSCPINFFILILHFSKSSAKWTVTTVKSLVNLGGLGWGRYTGHVKDDQFWPERYRFFKPIAIAIVHHCMIIDFFVWNMGMDFLNEYWEPWNKNKIKNYNFVKQSQFVEIIHYFFNFNYRLSNYGPITGRT